MILLPGKEYSQGFLDELNYIGYGFLESATEFLVGETDEEYLAQELKRFFPDQLVDLDSSRCYEILVVMYEWFKDNYYHQITRLNEYVLSKAIRSEWSFFNELSEEESCDLRDIFYSLSGKTKLSKDEIAAVHAMKNDELYTMDVFFCNFNFGEFELFKAFFQKNTITFLRF